MAARLIGTLDEALTARLVQLSSAGKWTPGRGEKIAFHLDKGPEGLSRLVRPGECVP